MAMDHTYEQMSRLADQSLRILFYCDDPDFMDGRYVPGRLRSVLERASMQVAMLSRSRGATITSELLEDYDEVWFFLRSHDGKKLKPEECKALESWMDDGHGVLVTGDHAEIFGRTPVGLGAPVGRLIPRAGKLREWGGGGSLSEGEKSFNTIEIAGATGYPGDPQADAVPQRLLLPVQPDLRRHPIFNGRDGRLLDRFPDHMHEGATRISAADWVGEPLPLAIARGIDHWQAKCCDLMVAWDGHKSPSGLKGRILADSSWHHYVDFNLTGIAAQGGEAWDKIQELYCNQAIWLAPQDIQFARCITVMRRVARWLAQEGVPDARALGIVALKQLSHELPGVLFAELLPMLSGGKIVSGEQVDLPEFDVYLVSAYMRRLQHDLKDGEFKKGEAWERTVLAEAIEAYRKRLGRFEERLVKLERVEKPPGDAAQT